MPVDYFEVLIGHAQLSVALAGFASLMLGIVRGRKSAVLSAWAARIVVVLAMFSASFCVVSLGLLSTSLPLPQVWFISSIIYIVFGSGGVAIIVWDSRRVYAAGIREQSLAVTVACWVVGGSSFALNFVNLVAHEPSFFYFYGGIVCASLTGLLLFLQNLILLSNDPTKSQ